MSKVLKINPSNDNAPKDKITDITVKHNNSATHIFTPTKGVADGEVVQLKRIVSLNSLPLYLKLDFHKLDGLKLAHELKMPSYHIKETILIQEKTRKRNLCVASDVAQKDINGDLFESASAIYHLLWQCIECDPEGRRAHWASWKRMSESKFSGGMGFRDLKAFNMAMLSKQGWMLTRNLLSFWGLSLKEIFFPNPLFLVLQGGGGLLGSGLVFFKGETSSFKGPDGSLANMEGARLLGLNFVPVNPFEVIHEASFSWFEFRACMSSPGVRDNAAPNDANRSHWSLPSSWAVFKVNCDIAMSHGRKRMAVAAVLQDWRGKVADSSTNVGFASFLLQGETMAASLVGRLLHSNNISNAVLEGDNRTVIPLCFIENVPPRECAAIIGDVKDFISSCNFSSSWVPTVCDRAAHWVATLWLRDVLPSNLIQLMF
ncbi:hypothetical protein RHSIM_Rhsim03G0007600 [Rhododendron simsii]|uniref:RNase H type-1 domain-containing protein n=1 Tax=Rhododendron simsii TaxID=118357 RepID=A0A834H5V4_RHOSS|nr:hypothetical protein RHSIM_Rhsim03G0007600 [Rhododendron simsii]